MKSCSRIRIIPMCRLFAFCLLVSALMVDPVPVAAKSYLKVALLKEPNNLNPFQTSDSWTKKVIRLIYQPLYLVDQDNQALIPWLAEDQPVYDPENKTVTFHLRKMRWDDGTEFTADDVVFTAKIFKKFQIPRYYAYWKIVEKVEAPDKKTVRMTLEKPTAVFSRRSLTSFVVQKKKWEPFVKRAAKALGSPGVSQSEGDDRNTPREEGLKKGLEMIQRHPINQPTGLGPFKFASRKKGSYILLVRNENFFGRGKTISGKTLGPYIDGVMFKIYGTLPDATLALEEGQIDFLWKGVSQAFVRDLVPNPDIAVPMTLDQGYRYLGFNLRRFPMSERAFRQAAAYLINKGTIVKRILHDHAQRLDSFVPPSNTFYYDSNTPAYGKGMDRKRRTREAYSILNAQGFRWQIPPITAEGGLQKGEGLTGPDGREIPRLSLITPPAQYDTEMAAAGKLILEWLTAFGLPVSWEDMPFGTLLRRVKVRRDFDMFIMGWKNLSLDPDYLRRFFHATYDAPNQWNFTGYDNAEFNRLADLQTATLNLKKRREIVFRMQQLLTQDLPYVPLYIPHQMEGIRTDRFDGWVKEAGGVGNIWTFCLLKPVHK
ncbi:MAG: ABC transporter substrate-binding protein [Deltaproteobacteria bacterium]|nr:ABC transporter substrate-binding protein [Deltaproteobacteria bacterium]